MKSNRNSMGWDVIEDFKEFLSNIPVIDKMFSRIGAANDCRSGTDYRREQNRTFGKREMAKRLKILLSIPINSPEYPEELDELLEVLWQENEAAGKKAVWKNSSVRFHGVLERLKESALRESEARIQNSLRELRELNGQR